MTVTTGMLMRGKMSMGMVTMDSPPMTAINMASTTNVYGRRRASPTIHMMRADHDPGGWGRGGFGPNALSGSFFVTRNRPRADMSVWMAAGLPALARSRPAIGAALAITR